MSATSSSLACLALLIVIFTRETSCLDIPAASHSPLFARIFGQGPELLEDIRALLETTRVHYREQHKRCQPELAVLQYSFSSSGEARYGSTDPLQRQLIQIIEDIKQQSEYKISSNCSLAVQRRIFVGLLVSELLLLQPSHRSWLLAEDLITSTIKDVFVQLYLKHRESAINRGLSEFLHVSKSGGTSYCHAAKLNGCRTKPSDCGNHCCTNVDGFEDYGHWINKTVLTPYGSCAPWGSVYGERPKRPTCQERQAVLEKNGWHYYNNEYTLHGGYQDDLTPLHVCSNMLQVVLFREPVHRLESHLLFMMKRIVQERCKHKFVEMFNQSNNAQFWKQLAPAAMDNYYVRSLLGQDVFHLPIGELKPIHLYHAKLMLMQYDLVVILDDERLGAKPLSLQYGLGWQVDIHDLHDNNITWLDRNKRVADALPVVHLPIDISDLIELNYLDWAMYRFARTVAWLDELVFDAAREAGHEPFPGWQNINASDPDAIDCGFLGTHYRHASV